MTTDLPNLDDKPTTRLFMLEEVERDIAEGKLYPGKRLTPEGIDAWSTFLRVAVTEQNDVWLEGNFNQPQYWLVQEPYERAGVQRFRAVNRSAAVHTLVTGEFLRFYLRGVCRRALEEGRRLRVVRLRPVSQPRPGSEAKIGNEVDAQALLDDLRRNPGIETFLQIPGGPNSGLGVVIVDD
ncbi:hypothetical protein [Amycolatopsis sp. NPDC059657]|uniref:hypothetical protein n=1 Tax=Amycolatopsis sp. NPDC059657 TaxID=3346899 RepID=UPI00366DA474